ncbi:hypothetical protein PRNP1_014835 [Phytophthora ramorum]
MRADPVVSQRLQQAAEQLQVAIRSARNRRKSGDDAASGGGKAWRLAPTVLLTPERGEVEAFSDDEEKIDWEQHSSEEDVASNGTSLASGPQSPKKEENVRAGEAVGDDQVAVDSVEKEMRKALDWMQRDVEKQARENRAVRETLVRTIHDITDIIADFVSPEAAELLVRTAEAATGGSLERDNNAAVFQLAPGKVDELVIQWEDTLILCREQNIIEKQELVDGFTHFEEDCIARMKAGEASHRSELERLAHEANMQQMVDEDYASSLSRNLGSAQSLIESLQRQVTTLSSQLQVVTAASVRPESCSAATETEGAGYHDETLQRQVLDLAARAKSAELYALRCEAALADQTQRTHETETRLNMLLEECEAQHNQRDTFRTNVVHCETVQIHRQKLELLESRLQDVLQQVACDHEQFEYDQAKWELEKRHHREKYDEVLDASVKVLKVLIIREKLMKKHERVQKRRSEECHEKQQELVCHAATLRGMTNELLQQSAMVLLVLQQLAVLKANTGRSESAGSWTLPAKPLQMKTMIKRLKKIEIALGRRDWVSVETLTAKVSPYPAGDLLSMRSFDNQQ